MKLLTTAIAAIVLGGLAQIAAAGEGCGCQKCGCAGPCRKVTCHIVCEMKKEKYHIYKCECEDFCLLGPGRKERAGCGCAGGECGCGEHCESCIWKPSWCHVHHRKVLKKYECEREIPCYKCVVVELCPSCCEQMSACGAVVEEGVAAPPAKEPVPPKPSVESAKAPAKGAKRRGLLEIFTSR
jgi:hypothetical protein